MRQRRRERERLWLESRFSRRYWIRIAVTSGIAVVLAAVGHRLLGVVIFVISASSVFSRLTARRSVARDRTERKERYEQALRHADRGAWRGHNFKRGRFAVILAGLSLHEAEHVASFLRDTPELRRESREGIDSLVQSVAADSPKAVARGISHLEAVRLRDALEWIGARATVDEMGATKPANRG